MDFSNRIVHCKKAKYDIYIGRGCYGLPASKFANPYVIGKHGTRDQVIEEYKNYALKEPSILNSLHELDSKVLGCWCDFPSEDCHGRVLLELREAQKMNENNPNKKYKVAIIGGRDFGDKERLFKILDKNYDKIEMIISGGAKGADDLGRLYAEERGFPCLIYYPRWHSLDGEYDKGAGFKRNYLIIKDADAVVAFWDKKSRGTANSLEIAKQLDKKIKIYYYQTNENLT